MGWRGTIRSVAAAAKRAEREARRRQSELAQRQNQLDKLADLERAKEIVRRYEALVERIATAHRNASDTVDWRALATTPPPAKPEPGSAAEDSAREKLERYRPGPTDRLLGRVEARVKGLAKAVEKAKEEDRELYRQATEQYGRDYEEWSETRSFLERVLAGEPAALLEVIREAEPFGALTELGCTVQVRVPADNQIQILLEIHGEEILPKNQITLLKSGRLSQKELPKEKFYKMFQDHVCSLALRAARETFAMLPVPTVIITVQQEILNSRTGHLEQQPILSVLVPRVTLDGLNLSAIDPSDSMANFTHNMYFEKAKGFSPIEPLDAGSIPAMDASTRES